MNEPVPRQDDFDYYTDMPVGEILRRARLHYGQSLADIERVLRIRAVQLEAIENGDLEKLPGRVYAIGFVRSYSEYLGLDGNRMVQIFKAQSLDGRARPELHFPAPASESKVPGPWVVASSVAAIILVIFIWSLLSPGEDDSIADIPPVPAGISEKVAGFPAVDAGSVGMTIADPAAGDMGTVVADANASTAPESDPESAEQTSAAPVSGPGTEAETIPPPDEPEHRVMIEVSERSWVDIRDANGKAILSRILEPGNSYFVPEDREGLLLTTGNAGGLVIMVDGEQLPPFGKTGEVRRNIPLNADQLKSMQKKRR